MNPAGGASPRYTSSSFATALTPSPSSFSNASYARSAGSTPPGSGGGGLGAGGAAFVRAGGTLTLIDPVFSGTITATGGAGGNNGQGIGQGLFLGGGVTINLSEGVTRTFGNDFLGGRGTQPASADPTNDTIGALTKAGPGTLVLSGANSYAGGTLFQQGTLSVATDAALGQAGAVLKFDGGALQVTGTAFTSTISDTAVSSSAKQSTTLTRPRSASLPRSSFHKTNNVAALAGMLPQASRSTAGQCTLRDQPCTKLPPVLVAAA